MRVTVIPVVIGTRWTISSCLERGLKALEMGGRFESIQTTALLKLAWILRRVLYSWADLLLLKNQWKSLREEKQLYRHFKRQTSEISHERTWTWLRKGNLKREIESFYKTSQNNAIRTMSKQELTRRNKTADVKYVVTEMKRSIL